VSVLNAALLDDDDRVRLWAHCALGIFLGRPGRHRQAIQEITAAAHGRRRKEVVEDGELALELLAESPGERDLRVLDFACFHNDVGLLQRVIQRLSIPALNSGPVPALAIAAVDRNRQAVRFLLEHGADPNVRILLGRTVLQDAARRRRTASIIRDLLEYGADHAARDAEGQTALAMAEHAGLWENARVLREFGAQ
jgi:ankyrin repeat protein